VLGLDFNRRLMLQFRGFAITSDAGLLAYRELDNTLGLTNTGADTFANARTGNNGRHRLAVCCVNLREKRPDERVLINPSPSLVPPPVQTGAKA
jgi:hypothetical protein